MKGKPVSRLSGKQVGPLAVSGSEGEVPSGNGDSRFPLIHDCVLQAAMAAGNGSMVDYLRQQAEEHPTAFMTLLGKVLTTQEVTGEKRNFKIDFTVRFVKEAGERPDSPASKNKKTLA